MTCKELIAELQKLPEDLEIVVAQDDEGNGFRFLSEGWVGVQKFDDELGIYAPEDYNEYDGLKDYICIG